MCNQSSGVNTQTPVAVGVGAAAQEKHIPRAGDVLVPSIPVRTRQD